MRISMLIGIPTIHSRDCSLKCLFTIMLANAFRLLSCTADLNFSAAPTYLHPILIRMNFHSVQLLFLPITTRYLWHFLCPRPSSEPEREQVPHFPMADRCDQGVQECHTDPTKVQGRRADKQVCQSERTLTHLVNRKSGHRFWLSKTPSWHHSAIHVILIEWTCVCCLATPCAVQQEQAPSHLLVYGSKAHMVGWMQRSKRCW